MLIKKKGTVLAFECASCGCEFDCGIKSAKTTDNGENYYCNCPMCGAECHTDWGHQDLKTKQNANWSK